MLINTLLYIYYILNINIFNVFLGLSSLQVGG